MGNGNEDNRSRLDRIEAALELIIGEHEQFRAEHKMLLKSQVLMQDAMDKMHEEMERGFAKFREQFDEVTGKLNGLIGVVDQMREHFDARLRRLESQ